MDGKKPLTREGHAGYVIDTCPSTMDLAWDLYHQGRFPEYAWVRARSQTRGRGQFGREWVSETGNLFATVRLPDEAHALDSLLPMALALILVKALTPLVHSPLQIKWPNDILMEGVKVGGILIEQQKNVLLAGIGINHSDAPEKSRMENFFHLQAGCLKNFNVDLKPSKLWDRFMNEFKQLIPGMISDPLTVVDTVQTCLAWRGEIVVLEDTGTSDGPARILEIDAKGRLCLQTAAGIISIRSGRIYPQVF